MASRSLEYETKNGEHCCRYVSCEQISENVVSQIQVKEGQLDTLWEF